MKKLLTVLLAVLLCLPLVSLRVMADEEESGDYNVVATFDVNSTHETGTWVFPYSDSYFKSSAKTYNHDLARLSLGMAVSAFRPNFDPTSEEDPSIHLKEFLYQCGFSQLRTDDYDKNPSIYTVSTAIASKTLSDEEGEFVLIAIGICGGGYTNEWTSNFSCGNGDEHLGFASAASEVYDRLFGYIAQHNLNDKRLKVWVSGFSRAAAVSNVFAHRVTDSSLFSEDTVYAYTFATPRTTRMHKEGDYPNIYNICGKMDPIPCVAFADWGFDRYGTTLYTPSQQTDSYFRLIFNKAAAVYKENFGLDFWNNVEWDTKLRVILDHILEFAPTTEIYTDHVQNVLISMWNDRSLNNVLNNMMTLANDEVLFSGENKEKANSFMTFLFYTALGYATRSEMDSRYNNEDSTLAGNVAHEHTPEVYLAWMFSTNNPYELFMDNLDYMRISITGDVNVGIVEELEFSADKVVLKYLKSNGKYGTSMNYNGETRTCNSDTVDIFMDRDKDETIILLPKDHNFEIIIESNKEQEVHIRYINLMVGYTTSKSTYVSNLDMGANEVTNIFSSRNEEIGGKSFVIVDGNDLEDISINEGTTSELARTFERINFLHLSWRSMIIILYTAIILIIIGISLFVSIKAGQRYLKSRQKQGLAPKDAKFNSRRMLIFHLMLFLFLEQELLYWLIPDIRFPRTVIKIMMGTIMVYVPIRGYIRNPSKLNLDIVISLALFMLADIAISYSLVVGMTLYGLGEIILSYRFYKQEKPEIWQLTVWLVLCAICRVVINEIGNLGGEVSLYMTLYSFLLMAFVILSLPTGREIRSGCMLMLFSNLMIFLNEASGHTLYWHVLGLAVYYFALQSLARSTLHAEGELGNRRPYLDPAEEEETDEQQDNLIASN